ncbi:MAG: hypothetical protein AAF841_14080 [Pseudomonadota bacterium]
MDIFLAKAKQSYYDRKVNSLKVGSGNWWRNIKSIDHNAKAKSPQAHYIVDNTLYDPQRFVDKLANYYATIAKCSTTTEECQSNDSSPDVNNQAVSIGEVKQYLRRINSSKSVNSEDYPPWVTKLCYEDLCVPITDIVNQSLQEAKYPMLYKQAEITRPCANMSKPASPPPRSA